MPDERDEPFSWGLTPKGDEPDKVAEPPVEPPDEQPVNPLDVPTEPISVVEAGEPVEPVSDEATRAIVPVSELTERMLVAQPGEVAHSDSLTELFGASAIESPNAAALEPLPSTSSGNAGGPTRARERTQHGERSRTTLTLIWVAAGLLAVVVLIGLFVLGTRLPAMFAGAPTPTPTTPAVTPKTTPTPKVTPTPTPATGPQPAGKHAWDTLRGGECLQPYTSPWEKTFTVVDCATPHAAQLVYTGTYPDATSDTYPGADSLAAQINVLCSAPGVLDLSKAGAYSDLQVAGSYPVDAAQWAKGQRGYSCFVSRASGDPMTVNVAGPGPKK